ncbi:2-phosphosulfolactate phosphatase [Halalkalibacillus halophilus]|uniref:2-phosphosulfolactate phosphatase n=1 Tax=Halalkalibacillus halophilus TaxID=392827 RepID=UPI0003F5D0AB|nr:2-phosphosulfolactate phosphatase [Halalkalibacillus halophilus]
MNKIHVITQKELVEPDRLKEATVVVIDVFLATSTITFLLNQNYHPVIATENAPNASTIAGQMDIDSLLLGENNGNEIPGFLFPDPRLIETVQQSKPAIICSTNGTRAIEAAKKAKHLYISSITNGHLVAEQLRKHVNEGPIVLICSGNGGGFSLEDFIGAGHIIDRLLKKESFVRTDAAKLAQKAFLDSEKQGFHDLYDVDTRHFLKQLNYLETVDYVIDHFENVSVLPWYKNGEIVDLFKVTGGGQHE